jgi:hypothetical protein
MINKQFKDLAVGERFTFNDQEYIRIQDEKVSCCRTHNAALVSNPATKSQITPLTEVQVND